MLCGLILQNQYIGAGSQRARFFEWQNLDRALGSGDISGWKGIPEVFADVGNVIRMKTFPVPGFVLKDAQVMGVDPPILVFA